MVALKFYCKEAELTRALEMTLWKEAKMIFIAFGFAVRFTNMALMNSYRLYNAESCIL
jgi:hypothetical protein